MPGCEYPATVAVAYSAGVSSQAVAEKGPAPGTQAVEVHLEPGRPMIADCWSFQKWAAWTLADARPTYGMSIPSVPLGIHVSTPCQYFDLEPQLHAAAPRRPQGHRQGVAPVEHRQVGAPV